MQSYTIPTDSPKNPTPVFTVCPRKKPVGLTTLTSASGHVAITFQLLKPYFNKPLTEAAEELGLSATAIKKACRTFGIPKWPFRTLASKTSRNRTAFQQIAMRLNNQEPIVPSLSAPEQQQEAASRTAQCVEAPVVVQTETEFYHSVGSLSFESAPSSASEGNVEESESTVDWEQTEASPLEHVDDSMEEKKMADNWLFDKLQATEADFNKFLSSSEAVEQAAPMESFDASLFSWNTV
eukprot:3698504-Rhodomonas_salina.1